MSDIEHPETPAVTPEAEWYVGDDINHHCKWLIGAYPDRIIILAPAYAEIAHGVRLWERADGASADDWVEVTYLITDSEDPPAISLDEPDEYDVRSLSEVLKLAPGPMHEDIRRILGFQISAMHLFLTNSENPAWDKANFERSFPRYLAMVERYINAFPEAAREFPPPKVLGS